MPHLPDSIHALAADLGISVNTVKTLCIRGVFPRSMVRKTLGGHWRVTGVDLPSLRIKLLIWKFWHRKGISRTCSRLHRQKDGSYLHVQMRRSTPSPIRSYDRQDELENLLFSFMQMVDKGFIFNPADYVLWAEDIDEVCKLAERLKTGEWEDNLGARTIPRLILKVHVEKLKQEEGKAKITVKELSRQMNVRVPTLYRIYGKSLLRGFLCGTVNDHYPISKAEQDRANDAIKGSGFRFRRSRNKVITLWDNAKAKQPRVVSPD